MVSAVCAPAAAWREVDAGAGDAVARYETNVRETGALLQEAKSALHVNTAFQEMSTHAQPILDKLNSIEARLARNEEQLAQLNNKSCCVVQ